MKNRPLRFLSITFCLVIISLSVSFQIADSQVKPLSLAQVLTGLQSKSGGFSLTQKNEFITKRVEQNGITFRLTPEIEKELKSAGASPALLAAIRSRSPNTRPTPRPNGQSDEEKPDATFDKLTIQQNAVENGVAGINILADFTVLNMKDLSSDIVFRFQKDGKMMTTNNAEYKTKSGELNTRRLLKPAYSTALYEDLAAFIPYKEFNLPPGVYNLQIDADVVLRDGKVVKHLTLQDLRLEIPAPIVRNGSAAFGKLWIDYNVKEGNDLGMRVHVKFTLKNMKDQLSYLQLLFEKQDGTKLNATNSKYKATNGQAALFRSLRPDYISVNYNDIALFIPYTEFNLPAGSHNLNIRANVIYSDYSLLQSLTSYPFKYSKK